VDGPLVIDGNGIILRGSGVHNTRIVPTFPSGDVIQIGSLNTPVYHSGLEDRPFNAKLRSEFDSSPGHLDI
jgi:hypothetical protein